MKFKRTRKFKRALRRLFSKWTAKDFRKAGVDNRYASDRVLEIAMESEKKDLALIGIKLTIEQKVIYAAIKLRDTKKQLEAAAHALSVIEAITAAYPSHFTKDQFKRIHELAQDAYGAAKK